MLKIRYTKEAYFCRHAINDALSSFVNFVETPNDDADILIYTPFDRIGRDCRCKKLFVCGENTHPDFNICDYAISSHRISFENRHLRIPFYAFRIPYHKDDELGYVLTAGCGKNFKVPFDERCFCYAMFTNGTHSDLTRFRFTEILSSRIHVDSVGNFMNNCDFTVNKSNEMESEMEFGTPIANYDKIRFGSKYRFGIAMENSSVNGYVTEKITDCFLSDTIPIYWGADDICEDICRGSFVDVRDYGSLDEAADDIISINLDRDRYMSIIEHERLCYPWYMNDLVKFMKNVVDGRIFEHNLGYMGMI